MGRSGERETEKPRGPTGQLMKGVVLEGTTAGNWTWGLREEGR